MAPTEAGVINKIAANGSGPIANDVIDRCSRESVSHQHVRIRRRIVLESASKATRNAVLRSGPVVDLDIALIHVLLRVSGIHSVILQVSVYGCRIEGGTKQVAGHRADHSQRNLVVRKWLAVARGGGDRGSSARRSEGNAGVIQLNVPVGR